MPAIKLPSVPKSAYNPDRKANDLLLAHIANLETALGRQPKNRKGRMTEEEAAHTVRHLSRHVHHRTLLKSFPTPATLVGRALATAPLPPKPLAKRPAKKVARQPRRKKR